MKKKYKIFKKGNKISKEQRNERQKTTRTHLLLKKQQHTFLRPILHTSRV